MAINCRWRVDYDATYNVDYLIVGQVLQDRYDPARLLLVRISGCSVLVDQFREVLQGVLFPVFSRIDSADLKEEAFLRLSRAVAGDLSEPHCVRHFVRKGHCVVCLRQQMGTRSISLPGADNCGDDASNKQQQWLLSLLKRDNRTQSYKCISFIGIAGAPSAYVATIQFGINGTAMAVLMVQVLVSIVVYEIYIRPMTDHGFCHFFALPCLISVSALVFAASPWDCRASMHIRVMVFAGLMLAIYLLILRDVFQDVRCALRAVMN